MIAFVTLETRLWLWAPVLHTSVEVCHLQMDLKGHRERAGGLEALPVSKFFSYKLYRDHCNGFCFLQKLIVIFRHFYILGRVPLTNRMIFRKNSKGPLTPPPSFLENCVAIFFYNGYGCLYARTYEGQIVWNACICFLQICKVCLF